MSCMIDHPAGVMDVGYATARNTRTHLRFRLRARAEIVVQAVRHLHREGPVRLLDVGSADGRALRHVSLALGSGDYVGVEYSDSLRSAAASLPSNVQLIAGDASSLSEHLRDESFDVVSMLALLEHLPDPAAVLAEARRVLRPGGVLVATCPDPWWDSAAQRVGLENSSHHVQRIDLKRLRELLESSGCRILAARRFMWAPVAVLPYLRIPVSTRFALAIDAVADRIPLARRLCVNAYVVGRRT